MSKATDKLSKLANFGASAGSKPAANAQATANGNSEPIALAEDVVVTVSEPIEKQASIAFGIPLETSTKRGKGSVPTAKAVTLKIERKPLVRNVIFTHEDQLELERIELMMREAGIMRPSIADVVRIALRTSRPTVEQTIEVFRDTKLLDGRTFEGKRLRQKGN
jgi:hypothetical protein